MTRLLIFLCRVSPLLRRIAWRWWYGKLAREVAIGSWTFMNYGYATEDTQQESLSELRPDDEPDRLCIQLYERVVSSVPLTGLEVLEVGSGRGGGSSYLARYHQPRKVIGIDFSPEATRFSQERHQSIHNLEFRHGDAERLPFPNASFDVVVNVESSHCYGNIEKFFREVARVLRPGGYFTYADLRILAEMEELKAMLLAQSEWKLIEEEDITASVARSLQADDARKRRMIDQHVAPRLQPIFHEFAGVEGGKVFQGLSKRELVYHRFVLRQFSSPSPKRV